MTQVQTMTAYVLGEWFLSKVNSLIVRIKTRINLSRLRRAIEHSWLTQRVQAIASISFLRLLFLLLKRLVSIVKSALRYFFIDLPIPALEFLYVLHFARAFLRLISYFAELSNKNSAEMTKFLLSCFKIFISFLILSLFITTGLYGIAPMSLAIYFSMKSSFRIYSGSKFIISFGTLLMSCYRREFISKQYGNDREDAWLRAQYKDNYWKHLPILFIGLATTILLSLLSFMGIAGLGPVGFIAVIVLACGFLLIDMIKSTYDAYHGTKVPEPEIGSLNRKNSLIDDSFKDYYYRKCRVGRLSSQDLTANKVYLLKEIIVKIMQLETKLARYEASQAGFFSRCCSEKEKITQKITGLIEEGAGLLYSDWEENRDLFKQVNQSFAQDYEAIRKNDKTILAPAVLKQALEHLIKDKDFSDANLMKENILWRLSLGRDKITATKNKVHTQHFYQSFFRKIGDCEDIAMACKAAKTLEQDVPKINGYFRSYNPVDACSICCIK
ncbi:MAG: hypothetical protein RLZZ225_1123 [Pseudomonadota bacterium]